MGTRQLTEVQHLVEELSPLEQAHLLEHLALSVARIIAASQVESAPNTGANYGQAWERFFRLGDELATSEPPQGTTLTQALLAARR